MHCNRQEMKLSRNSERYHIYQFIQRASSHQHIPSVFYLYFSNLNYIQDVLSLTNKIIENSRILDVA